MRKRERKEFKGEKLNLVPVMDAVFIFIFFLLFSAQFIKIFEIDSDAPIVSNKAPPVEKKEPLNLVVKIHEGEIKVLVNNSGSVHRVIQKSNGRYNLKRLKSVVFNLRKNHLDEDHVIISPSPKIRYETIIEVIDAVKILPEGKKSFTFPYKGAFKTINKIFSQIVLEPNT